MRIYLAGPMRGYELFNFPRFVEVADKLRKQGHNVISPVDLDHISGVNEYDPNCPVMTRPSFLRECVFQDFYAIAGNTVESGENVEAVVFLEGWENSTGAKFEYALARFLQLPCYDERLVEIKECVIS